MSAQPFRFLQSGDFRLGEPLEGISEIPEALRDLLIDAPRLAVERVVEAAVLEEVDFVALTGNLVDPQTAGARTLRFLQSQFEALEQHGIAVYWAGGPLDHAARWAAPFALPDGVHFFSSGRVDELSHFRGDRALATVMGLSFSGRQRLRPADFPDDPAGGFTVAIAHGRVHAELLEGRSIDYWALGGTSKRKELDVLPRQAHYAGGPQGRKAGAVGAFGCTIAEVANDRTVTKRFVATDALRWHDETVAVDPDATLDDMKMVLADRVEALRIGLAGRPLVVRWRIEQAAGAHGDASAQQLTRWLRDEYAASDPIVWTSDLRIKPIAVDGQIIDEDSMLGEYLRSARRHAETGQPYEFGDWIDERADLDDLRAELLSIDQQTRARVLDQATRLGAGLLSGEVDRP